MIRLSAFRRLSPALVLLAASLAACSSVAPPINDLAAAETALTAADQIILFYEGLPVCPIAAPICQTQEVKSGLKMASLKAFVAIEAARPIILANPNGGTAAAAAMTDVQAAMAALAAVTATVPKP